MVLDRFANWAILKGIASDPAGDSDHHGIPAILEYALLLDPLSGDLLPAMEWTESGASLELFQDPARSDVELKVYGCEDLLEWKKTTGTPLLQPDGRERTTVNAPQYFFRFSAL